MHFLKLLVKNIDPKGQDTNEVVAKKATKKTAPKKRAAKKATTKKNK
jgi:hypothetical protein